MKRSEKGSMLFLVLVVLAVILIAGTALLTREQYSHTYAIKETEEQQGYYIAKSIVDIAKKDIISRADPTTFVAGFPTGWSDNIEFRDAFNQLWNCKLKVDKNTPSIGFATLTAEAVSVRSNTKQVLSGIIRTDTTVLPHAFNCNNAIKINVTKPLEINQNILASTEGMSAYAVEKIKLQDVFVKSAVKLEAAEVVGRQTSIITGDIKTEGSTGVDIEAKGSNAKIQVDSIQTNGIVKLQAATSIKVGAIETPGTIYLKADRVEIGAVHSNTTIYIEANDLVLGGNVHSNADVVRIRANTISGSGTLCANHSSRIDVKNRAGTGVAVAPGLAKNDTAASIAVPTVSVAAVAPNNSLSGVVIESLRDITVYQSGTNLIAQYVELDAGTYKLKEQALIPDQNYVFVSGANDRNVFMGVQRATGDANPVTYTVAANNIVTFTSAVTLTGIDAANKNYPIYTKTVPHTFTNVIFYKNRNIQYSGGFQSGAAGAGGIIINDESDGLVFGSPGAGFIKYVK